MSIYTTSLWFRPYDPWATYHHLLSSELLTGFAVGLGILVASLVGSVVYDRFFCRYLCPMGAFLALISKLSWFKVRRDAELCIDCGKCDKACPVAVKVSTVAVVESPECINCNECVTVCPAAGALEVKAPNGKKISPLAIILITLGILTAVVGGTTAAGWFGWTTKTLAQEVENSGGKFDPDDIKGKSTFREISEASGIPESAFIKEYKLTEKDMNAEIKTFEEDRGFGPEEIREFVEVYLKTGKPPVKTDSETTEEDTSPGFDTAEIKASMTPRQTADASGVPLSVLQEKFSITDGQVNTPLKDIKGIAGFAEIDEVRTYVADYLKTH
jgi:Fe-S-cluster-containing hydrogenase component 2